MYKTTKILHISHGAVYVASAYAFYVCKILLSVPLVASIIISTSIGILLGIAFEVFLYYPLYKKKASVLLSFISSLGMYLFLINLIALIFGNEVKILQKELEKTYQFLDIILTKTQIIEILAFLGIFPLFYLFVRKTNFGMLIRAFSNNPELAVVLGMEVRRIRILAFGIGSALAAIAGMLVALDIGLDPNIGFSAV
ncbi:MAG: branched-chain amino acid ABC transporter permease, partial [Nitrospirota bacterium]|nr:branched-chain amino acid ABC transporter permease [Nitrospirota bacterium]